MVGGDNGGGAFRFVVQVIRGRWFMFFASFVIMSGMNKSLKTTLNQVKYSREPDNPTKSCKAKGSDLRVHFKFMRFEDEENEESYNKFRNRERKIFLMDYAGEYCSTTEHGELVIKQRFLMVNWIIEQSKLRELQNETMFLAVSLLDCFLTQGFFKNKRNLEVLGIACLTLAIRIEENQPLNWFYLKKAEADAKME